MSLFDRFRWHEVLVTDDETRYTQCAAALRGADIPCRAKTQALGHATRRSGTLGALGEDPAHSTLYQLFVKAPDLERAKRLCARPS